MSVTAGVVLGKAIFNILSNGNTMGVTGMTANKVQPMPMLDQGNPSIGVLYEINNVLAVNVKRLYRVTTAPLYNCDVTIECISTDYSTCTTLAEIVGQDLQSASGTFNNVKVNGFTLDGMQEGYNKERRYYSKLMSFSVRVLL